MKDVIKSLKIAIKECEKYEKAYKNLVNTICSENNKEKNKNERYK